MVQTTMCLWFVTVCSFTFLHLVCSYPLLSSVNVNHVQVVDSTLVVQWCCIIGFIHGNLPLQVCSTYTTCTLSPFKYPSSIPIPTCKAFLSFCHSEVQLKHSAALSIISPSPFVLAWMIMDMCGQQVTPLRPRNEASSEGG